MLYNEENRAILLERIPYLQNAINSIFDLADETIIESVMRLQVRRWRRRGMIPAPANPFEARGGEVWQPDDGAGTIITRSHFKYYTPVYLVSRTLSCHRSRDILCDFPFIEIYDSGKWRQWYHWVTQIRES
jgi:hypothetical protein